MRGTLKGKITALMAAIAAAIGTAGAALWARGRKHDDELDLEVGTSASPAREVPATASSSTPAAAPDRAASAGDDLTAIKGLGKVKAAKLVAAGVTAYAQIAAWTEDDIAEMGLVCNTSPGQIKREDWVGQAKALAESR